MNGAVLVKWSALGVLVLLAGCMSQDGSLPQPSPTSPPRGTLADFTTCRFVDHGGRTVECASIATPISKRGATAPPGWFCVDETLGKGVSLHRDPTTGNRGVHISSVPTLEGPVWGLVNLSGSDGRAAYDSWDAEELPAFFSLSDRASGNTVRMVAFTVGFTPLSPNLQGARLSILWVEDAGVPRPVERIDAPGGPYFFSLVQPYEGSSGRAYGVLQGEFSGADYRFGLTYREKTILLSDDGVPDPSC